jgi:TfoX/Sxy family transcriptional regulator of competence genes
MAWRKSPPWLIASFDAAFPDDPRAERRQMFGYPAGFVNGNMFAGLHQENMVVRLGDDAREELMGYDGAAPFEPMPGRPMRGYATLPPSMLQDPHAAQRWLRVAFEHALAMPPKTKKNAAAKVKKVAAKAKAKAKAAPTTKVRAAPTKKRSKKSAPKKKR